MPKRGQVTVFLILGILMLFISAGLFYAVSHWRTEKLERQSIIEKSPVVGYVEQCLRETATSGIYLAGAQGGVIYPEETQVLLMENVLIGYGYNGKMLLSRKKMEEDVSAYVEKNIGDCLDFSVFSAQGLGVSVDDVPSVSINILPSKIFVELDYPVLIRKGKDTVSIEDFSQYLPLRAGMLLNSAERIIQAQQRGNLSTSTLTSLDAAVSVFPYDRSTTIFSLSDRGEEPLTLLFAYRDFSVNTPPRLTFIPDMALRKDEPFFYEFEAEDEERGELLFSLQGIEHPVAPDGSWNFTPTTAGTFPLTITVQDEAALTDAQQVELVVE